MLYLLCDVEQLYLAVKAQKKYHKKEKNGPELGSR